MSNILKSAHLSKNYTNHCVRATCITVLSESGFEARHIVTISGHNNEQSVQNYVRDTSNAQKPNMSASILSLTTTTHVTAATEHLDINASDDQQAVNNTFDNDIDENDLVMSVAQYDNLVDSIKRGQTEIHPLSDTTTIPAVASVDNAYGNNLKRPLNFNNCQVTIQMIS